MPGGSKSTTTPCCWAKGQKRDGSGDRHAFIQIDILNGIEQFDTFRHRLLERLAPGNQPHATGTLVNHRGAHRLTKVAMALGTTTGVDQTGTAHIAARDLITCQVDWVFGRQLAINPGVSVTKSDVLITTVSLG